MNLHQKYQINNEKISFRIIDEQAVILNLDSGVYYSLNEVGSRAWDLCDGSKSIRDIATAICVEFEVERETAEKDILEVMDDLVREGLIRIHENLAPPESG